MAWHGMARHGMAWHGTRHDEELASEASMVHSLVKQCATLLDAEVYRVVLAHSAALVGKSLKLDGNTFVETAKGFIDCRDDLILKLVEAVTRLKESSPSSAGVCGIHSSLVSLSARLGMHQRTPLPRPTSKTKRPKAHHKRR